MAEKFKLLPLTSIVPDEEQPRKYFAATKMASLIASIKAHGMKTPISVEDMGNGKYLLEDGERRLKAAKELGLKEVPAVIEPLRNAAERVVQQFNIQEQHEAWSPVEKALAINRVSKELGLTLSATLRLLSVGGSDANRYAAFSQLVQQEMYVKNEIPLDYAAVLVSLRNQVKKLYVDDLNKEFTRTDEKKLEARVIHGIKEGTIVKRGEVTRLKDAFTKNPKLVEKFIANDKVTADSLFIEARAKGAYHLRNVVNSAQYVTSHALSFLKLKDVKITPGQLMRLKETKKNLEQLIALAE